MNVMIFNKNGDYIGRTTLSTDEDVHAQKLVISIDGKKYLYFGVCGDWMFKEASESTCSLEPRHPDDMANLHRAWPRNYTPRGKNRW